MRPTRERIEALRDDHADAGSAPGFDKAWCNECNGYCWPCDHYLALTLALEADTLRAALEEIRDLPNAYESGAGSCRSIAAAALGGTS